MNEWRRTLSGKSWGPKQKRCEVIKKHQGQCDWSPPGAEERDRKLDDKLGLKEQDT